MRGLAAAMSMVLFSAGVMAGTWSSRADAQGFTVVMDCGVTSVAQSRTTLYFGLNRARGGAISELEWQVFLRDEVTRRFPDGLTAWEAQGQWRTPDGAIDQERSKVLLLVHPDTTDARRAVQEVITTYRRMFEQQSVLWESARVCITA